MSNTHTNQKLLNSLLSLAAASLIVASPSIFAQGAAGEAGGNGTAAYPQEQQQQQTPGQEQAQDPALTEEQYNEPSAAGAPQGEEQSDLGASGAPQDEALGSEQDPGAAGAPGAEHEGQSLDQFSNEELKDRDVVNSEGEELGSVQELITGPDGEVTGIIVGTGGFMGAGERGVFAAAEEVEVQDDQVIWQTPMDQDALADMPEYEAAGTYSE